MTYQPQPSPKDDKTSETTQLLRAWAEGDRDALERLTPDVYRNPLWLNERIQHRNGDSPAGT